MFSEKQMYRLKKNADTMYVFICVGVTSPLKEVCVGGLFDDLVFGV